MASYRSAFILAVPLLAATSALLGCGEKKDTGCINLGVYKCYCDPTTEGKQLCQNGAFTPCNCGGGAAGTTNGSDNGGASGTGLPDGISEATTDTINTDVSSTAGGSGGKGGAAGTTAVADDKCPKGFTCSMDVAFKTRNVCNPPDTNTLLCTTDADCQKIGLPVKCMTGSSFNACVKFCNP